VGQKLNIVTEAVCTVESHNLACTSLVPSKIFRLSQLIMKTKVTQETFYTFHKGDMSIKESVSLQCTSVDWN
jgi:hypothetical protein